MAALNVHVVSDEALGNSSYLAEVGDGRAISVDPRRDVGDHLAIASQLRLQIVAVLETHIHADFVSGACEIAAATGAEIVAAETAGLRFAHRAVAPGDRIGFGRSSVEVISTPGHTPEHIAYELTDGDRRGVFTGGSLIIGGAARTDLSGADRTDELSRAQYASVQRLGSLPDDTSLYPTHGGGSFCSSASARSQTGTIGSERGSNPLFAAGSEEEFVEMLRAGLGSYPRYFADLPEVNRSGAPLLESLEPVREVSPEEARLAVQRDTLLIDARPIDLWARAHAEGSISIELRPAFASWLGWVVPFGDPFILMLEPEHVPEAVRLARRIGYEAIEGWIRFESWRDAGLPLASVSVIDPADAAERAGSGVTLLDVRQTNEFDAGHIPGATHLELGDIIAGELPSARDVITYCGHGERSATAAAILARAGIRVANLQGGSTAWRAAGLPLET